MPQMPPANQSTKYNEEIEALGVAVRAAAIAGHDFLSPLAASLSRRLAKGLRSEGLDGGNFASRFLRGGDAARTAMWITEPMRAAAADLYNCSVNMTTFVRRFRVGYVDAIIQARNTAKDDDIVVVR